MKCKRCKCEFQEDEPITTNGLCSTCHNDTLNPDVCIWCGERKKVKGKEACSECCVLEDKDDS